MTMKIDSSIIAKLLKKVYLGGMVEEAVVDFSSITVQAVDPTSVVFLSVSEKDKNAKDATSIGRVGVGSPTLSLLIKHLESIKGEVTISKNANRLVVAAKGRGEVKYLTVEEEFISTIVEGNNIDEVVAPCILSVDVTAQFCADFNSYMSLLKTKSARFCYDHKTRTVHVESGLESENQFSISVGTAGLSDDNPPTGDFDITVYGNPVSQIFSVLEWSEKESPTLLMAPDHPLVVIQDDNNIWACLPLTDSAGE